MADIYDYLKWRGDIPFKCDPFNEVDNLIFVWLTYVHFDEVLTPDTNQEGITLREVGQLYFEKKKLEERLKGFSLTKSSAVLLQQLMDCPRFSEIKVSDFVNKVDEEKQFQFSAMVFQLDRKTIFVAFRGTDDTIVGWKEDFNMCFLPCVPSQKEAVSYLQKIAKTRKEKMILGGHSKGGNLAVYAAMHTKYIRPARIIQIYNNDGPGFTKEILDSDAYRRVLPKIRTIIPESSVVGLLFEHGEKSDIVASSQKGLLQHDVSSWGVMRNRLQYIACVSDTSKILDQSIKGWTASLDQEQRRIFVESLFQILDDMNVKTTGELYDTGLRAITKALRALNGFDAEMKQNLLKMAKVLFEIMSQNVKANLWKEDEK